MHGSVISMALVALLLGCSRVDETEQVLGRAIHAIAVCPDRGSAEHFFPAGVLEPRPIASDLELRRRYSAFLATMGEPSLYCGATTEEGYRLTRLESAGVPFMVRAIRIGTTYRVRAVKLEAPGWMPPGRIVTDVSREIRSLEWQRIEAAFSVEGFWNAATFDDTPGGTDWILEGRRGSVYHVVKRMTPRTGPIRLAGLALMNAAGVTERQLEHDAPGVQIRPFTTPPGWQEPPIEKPKTDTPPSGRRETERPLAKDPRPPQVN
jgi:hypothetical protein